MNLIKIARTGYSDRYRGRGTQNAPLPESSGRWFPQLGPRSNIDYEREIGQPMTNSLVASCMGWLVDNWSQSDEVVMRKVVKNGEETEELEPEHSIIELIENPNTVYGGRLFREAIIQDLKLDGTAFAYVETGKYNLPVALWWLPTDCMTPYYTPGSKNWIDFWEYSAGGYVRRFAPEELLIWREGIDKATGGRRGFARFKAAIAEVYGDNEARNTVNTIMRNRAQMGMLGSPSERYLAELVKAGHDPKELGYNQKVAEEIEAKVNAKNTGDGRGATNMFSVPMQWTEFGSVLEHLDSQAIRSMPETRVCSVFGIHPVVLNLYVGLDKSSDKNNIQYANKLAWQNGMIPLQDRFAATVNEDLMPLMDTAPETATFGFDRRHVEALQEDANLKSERILAEWEDDALTHGEMRTALGLPVDKSRANLYYSDIQAAKADQAAQSTTQAAKELIGRKWRERSKASE